MQGNLRSGFWWILLGLFFVTQEPARPASPTSQEAAVFTEIYRLEDAGEWAKAREKLVSLLPKVMANHGRESRVTLSAINELAIVEQELGNYGDAERFLNEAFEIAAALNPADLKTPAQLLNNLSAVQQNLGAFDTALKNCKSSIEILQELPEPLAMLMADAHNNLANVYWTLGSFSKAEETFRLGLKQLSIENADHIELRAKLLSNLGGVLHQSKQEGETELQAALELRKQLYGVDHQKTLETWVFIGELLFARDQFREALAVFLDCYSRRLALLGENHMEVAEVECRIGEVYLKIGNLEKAAEWLGNSVQHYDTSIGSDHVDLLRPLFQLAKCRILEGDLEKARVLAARLSGLEQRVLEAVDTFASDVERFAYLDLVRSHHLFATLGDGEGLAEIVLKTHGVALDGIIRERKLQTLLAEPGKEGVRRALRKAREDLRRVFYRGGGETSEFDVALQKVVGLKRQILAMNRSVPSDYSLEMILERVGAGERVVQFVEYDSFDPSKLTPTKALAAIVLARGQLSLIPLGEIREIEELVGSLLTMASTYPSGGEEKNEELLRCSTALFDKLIRPVIESGGDALERLHVIPSETLSFLPFGILCDAPSGEFFIESTEINYLSNLREIPYQEETARELHSALLVGNPDYAFRGETWVQPMESDAISELFGGSLLRTVEESLEDLPGAAEEVRKLSRVFAESGKLAHHSINAREATEERIRKSLEEHSILHFATHGNFLPTRRTPNGSFAQRGSAAYYNPMFQGWLALAGSRSTLRDWRESRIPPAANDGILTAEELVGFDLSGCSLVCLSACQTAKGEFSRGGGIVGIRRGFRLAGAQSLLLTLWNIADEPTANLMNDFYQSYLETEDPVASLSKAKRKWLVEHREQYGLHVAVFLSGPFVVNQ